MNANKRMSEKGLKLLEQWEGFKNHVYRDSANLPTIGVGHLLTKSELSSGKISIAGAVVKYGDGLTNEQVTALLAQDVVPAATAVNGVRVALTQNQFDALCSFTFNVGVGAFRASTLLKLLNQGQYGQVPAQLLRWTRAGGQIVQGLVSRRNNEIKLWNGAL